MRNSAFLASALAASAVAMPHLDERAIVTRLHTATTIQTVVVYVTVTRSSGSPAGTNAPIGVSLSSTRSSVPASSTRTSTSVAAPTSTRAASSSAAPSGTTPSQVGPSHLSGPQQAILSSGADYRNAVLYHHNAARANHKAGPLVWNTSCEDNARITANTCNFAHYIPPGVANGQNLFTVSGTAFNVTAGITESWYKSELPAMTGHFGEASLSDDVFHQVGHLTQLLWQGTTSVGCVSIDCGANMKVNGASSTLNKYTVCNYSPPGNVGGRYATNVLPPVSTTNLGSWRD